MSAVIDFHSHVLPRMDDGSRSLEESIAMLQLEAEQGIRHVVATPHFYPREDTPVAFLRRRERAARSLAGYSDIPAITLGAEVYFFRGMSQSDALRDLTIGQSRYILIEMPPAPWSEDLYRELEAIRTLQGLTPVIAHIDRYIGPLRTYGLPERLAQMPVLVQANADFFLKRSTAAMAMKMLKAGQIHLLGSDCHNLTSRVPNLGEAVSRIQKKLGREALDRISVNEQLILGMDDAQRKGMV